MKTNPHSNPPVAEPAHLMTPSPAATPHVRPLNFDVGLTLAMMLVTLLACGLFLRDMATRETAYGDTERITAFLRLGLFIGFVLLLVASNLAYQLARLGYFLRLRGHQPVPHEELVRWSVQTDVPTLAILVPSYKEDLRTIRQTLISAALQEYPNRRVVLLVDDPPHPADPADAALLAAACRLPAEITAWLQEPAAIARAATAAFHHRVEQPDFDRHDEFLRLQETLAEVGRWFTWQIAGTPVNDHTDRLFVELVFRRQRRHLADRLQRLASDSADVSRDRLATEYDYLAGLFDVEVTGFERKRYVNLSHAPNKAANLNSYLGLLGRRVREIERDDGLHLETYPAAEAGMTVPDATYVATLDADSLLAPEYALRLIHLMEQPENERLAVAQTPYTAIPHPAGILERVAGATTDIQYVVHQGFTWAGATFWVGANAMLRKAAIEAIATEETERGYPVRQFIQDRTVIEDTESTVDLIARGWRLHNYPERLAFSATPADFGALLIQRRRWANGGLLILPKLLRQTRGHLGRPRSAIGLFLRVQYLVSPFATSIGLLGVFLLPVGSAFASPWLPLIAAPYFFLYGRDLRQSGYTVADLCRVYALNFMLLPINLAGVLKSIEQAITGEKIPFGRTPKSADRTGAPGWAVLAEIALFVYFLQAAITTALAHAWSIAAFSLVTAAVLVYVLVFFLGLRACIADLAAAGRRWRLRLVNRFV